MIKFTSNSTLNSCVKIVAHVNNLGKTIFIGIWIFFKGSPSPICKFCISVASFTVDSIVTSVKLCYLHVSTLTNCNSIDFIAIWLLSIVISPLNGLERLHLGEYNFPLIEKSGTDWIKL